MNVRQKLEGLGFTKDRVNLESAFYDENKNQLDLVFVYAEWNILNDEEKQKIIDVCNDELKDVSLNIKFKGAYIDKEILFGLFQRFLERNYKSLVNVFTEKSVDFEKNDKQIKINLICDKITADMITTGSFIGELTSYLSTECFYSFAVNIIESKQNLNESILEKPELSGFSLNWALEQEKSLNKLEVSNIEYLLGRVIESQPVFIKDINTDGEVVLAGEVSDFFESTYKKKSKDADTETEEGVKISFTLTDASGKIRVILFPNEKDLEKLRTIADGQKVVVVGNLSQYKDNLSLRARGISKCELVSNEIHYCYRGVNDKYNVVKPKPWVEVSQMDLFSLANNNISDYLKNNTIVMFDLETTGLDPETCMITEIGAVKIENGKCTEYFQTLVNPQMPIPQEVVDKTHITDEMVSVAPTIDEVMPDFYKFVDGAILSAYNISFDYSFLKNIGQNLRYKFDNERIDCLDVVRQKVASLPNYKLSTVSKALNIELKNAHRALADALAAAKVFIKLM